EWLFREFGGDSNQVEFGINELEHRAAVLAMAEGLIESGIFVSFSGQRTFISGRGFPVVQGLLKIIEPGSGVSRSYLCNSGGGARDSHARNGPAPPGTYRVN